MSIWRLHSRQSLRHIDGMHAAYINGMLRSLVFALVGIFTPIYLYKIGMEQWGDMRYAISFVALYYLLTRLTILLTSMPCSRTIEKIGFRRSIAVSLFLLALNLGALLMSAHNYRYIYLAAIVGGFNVVFYWISRNSMVSQDGERTHVGKQMGTLLTIEHATTMLGPVAAGLMIEKWGFPSVYISAIVVLIISVIPLWHMPPHVHKNGVSLAGFRMWITNRRFSHIAVGVGGRAVDDYAIAILWPLAIFILGVNTGVLGGIFSAVAVVSLVARLLLGNMFDTWRARGDFRDELVYGVSAIVTSIAWVVRIFITSVTGILVLDIASGVFGTAYSSLYINYQQLGGMRMGSIAYWVYNEMVYSILAVCLMGLVIVGAWFGIWKEISFVFASLWVLSSIVMARESNLK